MTGPVVTPRPSGQMRAVSAQRSRADACTMVIFGAMGDLTRRKLMPAVYELMKEGLVDPSFTVLGVGRESCESDDVFRQKMREALMQSDEVRDFDEELWTTLCSHLHYVCAELDDASAYGRIVSRLAELERPRDP